MHWNEVPPCESVPKDLIEWKNIFDRFPPSFYDVWVWISHEKKRYKAYFDAPNRRWVQSSKDVFNSQIIKQVKFWKEIEGNSIEFQHKELDDFLDCREEQRKSKKLMNNG